jgi:hypothetical protein
MVLVCYISPRALISIYAWYSGVVELGIIELILTIMGYNRFDFLSLGIVLACAILFSRYVRKRNIKDIVLRTYDAMELTEEEYQTKYNQK